MTGYYPHTLHTGNACDLRRRESVKGVTVLQVNRPGAREYHTSAADASTGRADVKGEGL
jgi:hypothetical protein